jgi:hypothetical protein
MPQFNESLTSKNNRLILTEYWEKKGVVIPKNESIDDYIVVPGDKTDWLFYPLIIRIKSLFKKIGKND